jgi:hypothetical protein
MQGCIGNNDSFPGKQVVDPRQQKLVIFHPSTNALLVWEKRSFGFPGPGRGVRTLHFIDNGGYGLIVRTWISGLEPQLLRGPNNATNSLAIQSCSSRHGTEPIPGQPASNNLPVIHDSNLPVCHSFLPSQEGVAHLMVELQGGGGMPVRIGWGKGRENLPLQVGEMP